MTTKKHADTTTAFTDPHVVERPTAQEAADVMGRAFDAISDMGHLFDNEHWPLEVTGFDNLALHDMRKVVYEQCLELATGVSYCLSLLPAPAQELRRELIHENGFRFYGEMNGKRFMTTDDPCPTCGNVDIPF